LGGLSFIGLGLHDEEDMSLKAVKEAKDCDIVYAEYYTSIHDSCNSAKLEKLIGKRVEVINRQDVEERDIVLANARTKKVGFLVPGDPMTATTHVDLRIRAEKDGIRTTLIHGTSIQSAVSGLLGLQSYKFGRSTTIPVKEKGYEPKSPYEVIKKNLELGLHTLVLLDIIPSDGRTMTANEAMDYLLETEQKFKEEVLDDDTIICIVADAGSSSPFVKADSIRNLKEERIEHRRQTIVVLGKLHFMEAEALIVLASAPKGINDYVV
jgi:diphthine synthase